MYNLAENEKQEIFLVEYQPKIVSNRTDLTLFSANQATKSLSVSSLNQNRYVIQSECYSKNVLNLTFNRNYILELFKYEISISKDDGIIKYKLIKNVSNNSAMFEINKIKFELTDSNIVGLVTSERLILEELISIYIEVYDVNAKRLSSTKTDLIAKSAISTESESCYKFESAVGFTSSASGRRATRDSIKYISDGNSDCKIGGSDTSCVVDSHVCITTVTMECSTSCKWWN